MIEHSEIKSALRIFFALVVLFLVGCAPKAEQTSNAAKNLEKFKYVTIEHPDKPAPLFSLTGDKNEKITNENLKGRIYIMQGFAPGCSSCAREIATLDVLYSKYHGKGLEIISLDVASNDLSGALDTKKKFNGGEWHWTIDTDDVAVKFGLASLESTYIVGRDGIIRYKDETISDSDVLSREIEKLI